MPALYVQNIPDELYQSLKRRAKEKQSTIAAEVIEMLSSFMPSQEELDRRWAAHRRLFESQQQPPLTPGPFPTAEEMLREDRQR